MRRATIMFGMFLGAAVSTAAPAQSCWPVGVLLALRDSAGRPVAPAAADSIHSFPGDLRPTAVSQPFQVADPASALQWARSGCRLRLDSATVWMDGRAMTLVFGMDVDSEARRAPSVFFIESPPFRPGTFRLCWDPAEAGGYREPSMIPAAGRWTQVSRD